MSSIISLLPFDLYKLYSIAVEVYYALRAFALAHFVWNGDIVLNVAMSGGGVDWPWICILAAILGVVWVIASRKR